MTCSRREQDLLLLAHGALPLWNRLNTQRHLRRCAVCRRHYAQLTEVSNLLAVTIRDPGMPQWSLAQAGSRAALFLPSWMKLAVITVTLMLLLGLVMVFWRGVHHAVPRGTDPNMAAPSGGCRPDLPNSRCR